MFSTVFNSSKTFSKKDSWLNDYFVSLNSKTIKKKQNRLSRPTRDYKPELADYLNEIYRGFSSKDHLKIFNRRKFLLERTMATIISPSLETTEQIVYENGEEIEEFANELDFKKEEGI